MEGAAGTVAVATMEGAGTVAVATGVAGTVAVAIGVAAAIMAAATGAGAASAGASQLAWPTAATTPRMLTTMDTITATLVSATLGDIGSSIAMATAC